MKMTSWYRSLIGFICASRFVDAGWFKLAEFYRLCRIFSEFAIQIQKSDLHVYAVPATRLRNSTLLQIVARNPGSNISGSHPLKTGCKQPSAKVY
jgi:hypothetical protein